MTSIYHRLLVLFVVTGACAVTAADNDPPPITPEKLQFDQKRAAAHMLEMEDRM